VLFQQTLNNNAGFLANKNVDILANNDVGFLANKNAGFYLTPKINTSQIYQIANLNLFQQ